jgi:hypothetical protein
MFGLFKKRRVELMERMPALVSVAHTVIAMGLADKLRPSRYVELGELTNKRAAAITNYMFDGTVSSVTSAVERNT